MENSSSEEDEDSMAMIVRGLEKIYKSKKFDPKKYYKKGFSSKKNDKNLRKGINSQTIKTNLILVLLSVMVC